MYVYNIHGLIHVYSNTKIDVISKYFLENNNNLSILSRDIKKLDGQELIIEVSDSPLENKKGLYINDEKHLIGVRFKKGPFDVFLELSDLDKRRTKFRVSSSVLKIPMLKQRFTDTILHILDIKLIQQNYVMIHAAAGVYKNRGYILAGGFGAGKSLSTFFFIKHGAIYFTDDIIIISKEGYMYSYPLKVALYPYHFRICNWLKKPNFIDLMKIYIRAIAHTLIPLESGIQIVDPFIGEKEIFEIYPQVKIGKTHRIDYLVLLETLQEEKYELKEVKDKDVFFEKFFITNKKVFNYEYNSLILVYSYYYPEKISIIKIVEKEKSLIRSIVAQAKKFLISRAWGELHADQLIKFIETEK